MIDTPPPPDVYPCGCRVDYKVLKGRRTAVIAGCRHRRCPILAGLMARSRVAGARGAVIVTADPTATAERILDGDLEVDP